MNTTGLGWDNWCWGGGWVDGNNGGDDSWDTGGDQDGAQAVLWLWYNWGPGGGWDWDDCGLAGGDNWADGRGGVVERWDRGGVDVAGGGGDGALSWAVGDSSGMMLVLCSSLISSCCSLANKDM